MVAAAFHHLPASEMEDLESGWKPTCWCARTTRRRRCDGRAGRAMRGLRALDAGSLTQAAPIEAFTAVCITLNIRHKAHSTLRIAGI